MRLPQIQIHQQPAKLGIEIEWGVRTIHQQRAQQRIETVKPPIEVKSTPSVVHIDQSQTWDAITGGKPEGFMQRIYSQTSEYVKQHNIAVIQKWRQIADLEAQGNPIPDLAAQEIGKERPPIPVYGPASVFNTKINIEVHKPEIRVEPWRVNIEVEAHQKPEIEFTPGKVRYWMEQYPSVTVEPPPAVDLHV